MARIAYDDLALVPFILAENVARREYTGEEMSIQLRSSAKDIAKVEELRKTLTPEEEHTFCNICDERCKHAYNNKSDWFMRIVRMEDGRAQLEMFLTHWLVAFLKKGKIS